MVNSSPCLAALFLGSAALGAAQPQAGIPIESRPGERVILKVEAKTDRGQTRTMRMLLDTGARFCVVDRASTPGLVTGMFKLLEATGFSGRSRHALKRTLIELRLGQVSQTSVPVLVMDLSERNKWQDEPVDGLLGMSFLEDRRFLVDPFQATFSWEGEVARPRTIPLKARDGYFYLPVQVAGKAQEALLDTGASGTIYVSSPPPGIPLESDCEMGSGIDGFARLGRGRADLDLFGERFVRRPFWSGGSGAVLGAAFLLAGPTVFDLKGQVLQVSLDETGKLLRAPSLPGEVSFPICWNRKNPEAFLEVAPMPTCHRWYLAGFRPGDRVLAVGSDAGKGLTLTRLNGMLRDGQVLDWRLLRGQKPIQLRNPSEDRRRDRLDEQDEGDALSPRFPPAVEAIRKAH